MRIVYTGIQPTGRLHLGNYFGAIKYMLEIQHASSVKRILSIADLHSLTVPKQTKIAAETLSVAATLLACGLDPDKVTLFRQSDVDEHIKLMWFLMTQVSTNRLMQMIQWKEKSESLSKNAALLCYPVLQAADILLYKTDLVPVGPDQKQHLELTMDIAKKVNAQFGKNIFKIPEVFTLQSKICSLSDPTTKMSKSSTCKNSCLFLVDDPETIREKIKKAVTDGELGISYDEIKRPGTSSLLRLYSQISNQSIQDIIEQYKSVLNISQLKMDLADLIIAKFAPTREKYHYLISDPTYLCKILETGAETARTEAATNFKDVWDAFF